MSNQIVASTRYTGRFAPTPSGPLHLGSLATAAASWIRARRQGGLWYVRFDDLDQGRCPPGASDDILQQLARCELHWDAAPYHQRDHLERYRDAAHQLQISGHLFPCNCTRAALRTRLQQTDRRYDGHCLRHPPRHGPWSLRFLPIPADGMMSVIDGAHGPQSRPREGLSGFPVWRSDDLPAYALAGALDEVTLGITEVVRGDDLLEETFAQVMVLKALGLQPPDWYHLPLLYGTDGRKLSKQNHAAPVATNRNLAPYDLSRALQHLGYPLPSALTGADCATQLSWACATALPDTSR